MVNPITNPLILFPAIIAGISIVWLVILTVIFFGLRKHYNQLINKTNKKNLQEVLDEILKSQHAQRREMQQCCNDVKTLQQKSGFHLQKIGFLRFNPFNDTGGDQSFVIALLDNHKNGIVLSSLHNRELTRLYAKQVKAGKGIDFELSTEEQKALLAAKEIVA